MPNRVISVIRPCGTLSGLAYDGANAQLTAILRPLRFVAELLADRHQVGQRLRRMVDVALHVDDRHVGGGGHRPHVLVALVEHEVVPDADAVAHRGENLAGVFRRFAVADLRGVGVEEVRMPAELRHAGFERVASAGRLIEEQQERRLMRQQQRRLAAVVLFLQVGRRIEQQIAARRRDRSCVSM